MHRKRQLLGQRARKSLSRESQVSWALRDVSFKVESGEKLAIIGTNGAGKSTLLEIITGVTSPTTGSVRVHGQVSALLALGAGMHPDLTGLENIHLIASLMEMSRANVSSNPGMDRHRQDLLSLLRNATARGKGLPTGRTDRITNVSRGWIRWVMSVRHQAWEARTTR